MLPSELYRLVREKEGRHYSDEIAASLPQVPDGHPLHDEWTRRAASLHRFLRHIEDRARPNRILELGCGNGWLSHRVSALPGARVWGIDLFGPELMQAALLFGSQNLSFLAADIFRAPFAHLTFDVILVASVIQYFPDVTVLIRTLLGLLKEGGELHVMDSPLYEEHDLPAAKARTREHYAALGIPEMTEHYFHHTYAMLQEFAPRWHYRPDAVGTRILRRLGKLDSPFPWLSIG